MISVGLYHGPSWEHVASLETVVLLSYNLIRISVGLYHGNCGLVKLQSDYDISRAVSWASLEGIHPVVQVFYCSH